MASKPAAPSDLNRGEPAELRRCLRDLVALTALPAVWTDKEPRRVAQSLADALLAMLGVDVACVFLNGMAGSGPVETARTAVGGPANSGKIVKALRPLLDRRHAFRQTRVGNPLGSGELEIMAMAIGHQQEYGFAVAGSQRPGFPTEFERLMLGVAVNQAAIGLENASLVAALRAANRAQQELLEREKTAREEAETAEHRFRDLIQGLDAIVWEAEGDPVRFTFVSQRAAAMLGYSPERWLADPGLWTALVHPEDRERVTALRRTAATEGQHTAYEYRGVSADGRTVWLHDLVYTRSAASGARQLRGITVDITERKRTEAALRKSDERFARFMHYLPGAAWMKDDEGRYVYANETAEWTFGAAGSELRGKRDEDVLSVEAARQSRQHDEVALATGRCFQAVELLPHPDGPRHFLVSRFPIFDAEGLAVFAGGIAIDITGRKRAEEGLRKSESRLRALIENSSDAIALATAGGKIIYASSSTARVLGYTPEEFAGRQPFELVHPDDLEKVRRLQQEVLTRPGEPVAAQVRIRHQDGSYRWIEGVTTNLLADADVQAIVTNYRDITERKQFEGELRRNELRYSTLAEAIPGILFTNLPDGWRDYTSRRFYEFTGMPAGAADGFGWMDALHPEDVARTRQHWRECVGDGNPFQMQYRFRRADGAYRWFDARSVPMRDPDGGILKWFGVCVDIDDQRRAEEVLREAHKLESIGVLAGGIAHDFNNLLVGVMGNASLALDLIDPTSPAVRMLHEVVRASERAAGLTRQLLAYAGKGQIALQWLDVSELVRDIYPLIRTTIANAELTLDLEPGLPAVEGDAGQLQQVAMNLIINAAEAIGTRARGQVTVRTGVREFESPRQIQSWELSGGKHVYLEVRDTGCGMDSETLSRIFNPFFTTKFTGRGLGLAAASGIIRAHHGAIEVETEAGAGSRFTIYLPAIEGQPAGVGQAAVQRPRVVGSGVVLVVDDEEVVCRTATRMLESLGYEARAASCATEATALLRQAGGDLVAVLLDLTMPGMSGLETLRLLKGVRREIPVVLSSGYSEVEARRRFQGEELAGFIQKPYTTAQLGEKLGAIRRGPGRA